MKPFLLHKTLLLAGLMLLAGKMYAEDPAYKEISVNNIRASVHADGLFFTDDNFVPGNESVFEVPKGGGNSALYAGSLWASGFDEGGNLYTAAQTYRQRGVDYHPGPSPETLGHKPGPSWNKLWKVTKDMIKEHRQNYDDPDYNMPAAIEGWPAHADGASSDVLAPYFDKNRNEQYEPHSGDYPFIKGDEAIYFIFSDAETENEETNSPPMGIEVKGQIYGYDEPDHHFLDNTLFLDMVVTNTSENTYEDVSLGLWSDIRLGDHFNNYFGSSEERNMYYGYLGEEKDEHYGELRPSIGVTLLNQDLGHTSAYLNNAGKDGNPESSEHYHNYLIGENKEGEAFSHEGSASNLYYPGNPCTSEGVYEADKNNPMGDRRGLGAVQKDKWEPGEHIEIQAAYVFGESYEGNAESVCNLKDRVRKVRDFYEQGQEFDEKGPVLNIADQTLKQPEAILYPNPADEALNIELEEGSVIEGEVSIFDMQGRKKLEEQLNGATQIDVAYLESGSYIAKVQWEGNSSRHRLLIAR